MIRLFTGSFIHTVELPKFNAGELNFKTPDAHVLTSVTLDVRDPTSEELFSLQFIVEALRAQSKGISIKLLLPYMPYSRQDRRCNHGEAFSLKVFANYLNSLEFDSVETWDAHSDVTGALVNNLKHVTRAGIISTKPAVFFKKFSPLVSPDAGAVKKAYYDAANAGIPTVIKADKERDVTTGKILSTSVYADSCHGDLLITDDICDGGRTFIELAKVLKAEGADSITLFVTHGIFANDAVRKLYEAGIDKIITTNSLHQQKNAQGWTEEVFVVLNI